MCGIAGFVEQQGTDLMHEQERRAVLDRMCHVITHRGPDDQGTWIKEHVALGMRRLSIIDLAGGQQPISNEDDQVRIVFNGEIYNYRELRQQLQRHGHRFQTDSDTETIVHAYEEYGVRCVDHLRGMFAFAIWDARAQSLFIARDRAGKKPLYYTLTKNGTLVFGSELKSLVEHPEVERTVNAEALDAYLTFGYVPDPLSIFEGVHKLSPGHHLSFADGKITVEQYWDFKYTQTADAHQMREEEYIEELRRLLAEAVRIRLVADVPLGAFLSGGIDSSVVVGLMARHSAQPVKTFSIGFREDNFNELHYARIAAKHFGTDHHEFIVTPDICQIVNDLVWHFDEPFADQSSIPTYMVSKLARQYVTVALSGDGGDELFAGYTRYATHRARRSFNSLPSFFRHGVMQPLSRSLPHGTRGRNYLYNIALDSTDRYLDSVSMFTELGKRALYTDDFRRQLCRPGWVRTTVREYAGRVRTGEELDELLYIDSKTYLPGDILVKVDRMSMAVSLEARAPLLDHKLIEFVTGIPAVFKMQGLETKAIFKQAVRDFVPAEILDRPKQGFGMPLSSWINQELRTLIRDTLTEQRTRERGYFDPRYINVLFDEHSRGRRDHSVQLWTLFVLELWQRSFADAPMSRVEHRADAVPLTAA